MNSKIKLIHNKKEMIRWDLFQTYLKKKRN